MTERRPDLAERRRRFDRRDDPKRAVEDPPVRDGVQVRAGGERGQRGCGSRDDPKKIPPGVDADVGPGLAHPPGGDPRGIRVLGPVGEARDAALACAANRAQFGEALAQPGGVDAGSGNGSMPPTASGGPRSL